MQQNPANNSQVDDAIVMGKISAPDGLFAALAKVRESAPVELAVLFVFSKDFRGRLFIHGNRIITGARLDPINESGIKAVQQLLAVQRGMFGFRLASEEEFNELHQGMSFDIDELLRARAAAVKDAPPPQSQIDTDDVTEATELDPAYLDWLRSEREKVFADIENSIARAKISSQSGSYPSRAQQQPAQSITQNYEQYEQYEQYDEGDLGDGRWEGLDSIPTPASLTGGNTTVQGTPPAKPTISGLGQVEAEQNIKERFKQSGRFKKPEENAQILKQSARLRAVQSDPNQQEKDTEDGGGGGFFGKVKKLFGGNKDEK